MNEQEMNLNRIIADVVTNIPQKIYEVLSNWWGKLLTLLTFCVIFLGDRFPLLVYIGVAVLFDALWGINTARKLHKFIFSELITKSAIKIAAYVSVYALVALAEKGFTDGNFTVTSSIVAAILITSELWSILGHIAIVVPDSLIVKLLRKYLKGEMSKKLNISEKELDEILKKDDKPKKKIKNGK